MRVVFFLITFSISTSLFSQMYAVKDINPLLVVGVNGVLRFQNVEIQLLDYDEMVVKKKTALTIFNERLMDELDFYFFYDDYVDIERYEAKIYNEAGLLVKTLKKKDFSDVSASGGDLYSDDRAIVLNFTPSFYPLTIEFTYEITNSSTLQTPSFYPLPYGQISVEEVNYRIINEKQIPLVTYKSNLEGYEVETLETPTLIHYNAKNLRPIIEERYAPPLNSIVPNIRVVPTRFELKGSRAEVHTWDDFARWQNQSLLKNRDELTESTRLRMNQLVSGIDDPKEKIKRIYEYMQQRTRYISVQVGIGGWRPFPADEVDKLGYGDCKGLSNYTKALLNAVNIPSYYTIVDSGPNGQDLIEDFVGLQGNHVILSVPLEDEMLFLECTSQQIPFNFLGTHTDNRKVLMITPEGGKMTQTHTYGYKQNLQTTKAEARLNADLELSGHYMRTSSGIQYQNVSSLDKATHQEVLLHYKEKWDFLPELSLEATVFKNDKDAISFSEELNFKSPTYTSKAGNRILLNPNLFNRFENTPPNYANRIYPLYIRRGFTDLDEVEIIIPEEYPISSVFEDFTLESEYGNYKISIEKIAPNKLIYRRKLELFEGQWPKEKYPAFASFLKTISKKDRSKIVLSKPE